LDSALAGRRPKPGLRLRENYYFFFLAGFFAAFFAGFFAAMYILL